MNINYERLAPVLPFRKPPEHPMRCEKCGADATSVCAPPDSMGDRYLDVCEHCLIELHAIEARWN